MKISVFSGKKNDINRKIALQKAIEVAQQHGSDLLILPGYSLGQNKKAAPILQSISDNSGIPILGETWGSEDKIGDIFYCFRPQESPIGPFIQRFSTHKNATYEKVQMVADEFKTGCRQFQIGHKTIGVLLCGENNFLKTIAQKGFTAEPRFPDIPFPLEYNILVNPSHTSMGEWHRLHKRFAYFSQSKRTFIYCTNNSHEAWKTAICIYQDGKLVMMGDFESHNRDIQTYIGDTWRLATYAIK